MCTIKKPNSKCYCLNVDPKEASNIHMYIFIYMYVCVACFYGQKGARKTRHHFVAVVVAADIAIAIWGPKFIYFKFTFAHFMLANFDLKIIKIVIKMQPRTQFMTKARAKQ